MSADVLFFPGCISLSRRRAARGAVAPFVAIARGADLLPGLGWGPGWGRAELPVCSALPGPAGEGRGEAAEGREAARARPAPPRPGRARPAPPRLRLQPRPSPCPPRSAPPRPAPPRARCLPAGRALGRCQRGAPEGGRSAARRVWFRRGSEGGGQLWPWGSPSSTAGSRSGTPASARC